MRGLFTKRKIAIGVAIASLGVGGVVAYAAFTSTGTGTGTGSVGSATTWGVSSTTSVGSLYPGNASSDETVTVTIKNNGSGYQLLNSFIISVANNDGTAWTPTASPYATENGCSQADFRLGTNTGAGSYTVNHSVDSTLPDDLAPGATYTTTVNLHMLDTLVPQDNCQATSVPLYISAS